MGWKAPEARVVRVNYDGSFRANAAGIGLGVRDEKGGFIWDFGEKLVVDYDIVAEILALRKAHAY